MIAPPPPLRLVGVDSETAKIQAGRLAPPLACVSTAERNINGGFDEKLFDRNNGVAIYHRLLSELEVILVIHNAPFDLAVACNEDPSLIIPVFDAYEANRICNTVTLQKLIDVAMGMRKFRRYNHRVVKTTYYLEDLIEMYYGEKVAKEDTWRLSYGLLIDIPIHLWPTSACLYAMYDAVLHLRLYEAQLRTIAQNWGELPNQAEQQRAAWVLHLMGMWGIRAEKAAVDRFIDHCMSEIRKMQVALVGTGILKSNYKCRGRKCGWEANESWVTCPRCGAQKCSARPDGGGRIMKEIHRRVTEALQRKSIPVPRTDPSAKFPDGQVKADEDTLRLTGDDKLIALADSLTFQKHLGQWGPVLSAAVIRPVCCRYNELVDNGRTSCSGGEGQEGTNIQNPPRKGDVRPCIIARLGWVLCSTDADTIELRANAQNCLELVGRSRMAEVIRRQFHEGGPDLHVVLGAGVAAISEAEAHRLHLADDVTFANIRQLSKHGNFAFAGGAGAEMFVAMARGFGIKLGTNPVEELARSTFLRLKWFETWPEMHDYFDVIARMVSGGRRRQAGIKHRGVIRQLVSGRIRGDCTFTAAANTFFSGRVADAMKEILWRLALECYTGRTVDGKRSVLYGSRPVMFLHDEPILEHPEDGSESERAERQRVVVVDTLNKWMPDVPCTSSAVLMRRWQKGAKGVVVNGRLVPSKPEKVIGSDGRERVNWVHDKGDRIIEHDDFEMDVDSLDEEVLEDVS
jgi:hypothetical protein